METIALVNGNGQNYTQPLPKIVFLTPHINDVALKHIAENTGLWFSQTMGGYEATPTRSSQITALFMTYNFKTRYYDNLDHKNTLFLKTDHHIGFDVDSICLECCKHNHIHSADLSADDRLAC